MEAGKRATRRIRPGSVAMLSAGAVSFLVAGVMAAGPATADKGGSSGAPPGNNATIKINNIPFDDNVNNEPHVTCPFLLSLYNFDSGSGVSNSAEVDFAAQPPSGQFVAMPATGDPQSFTFPGPDAQKTYSFSADTLAGLTLQPQQGYHVKVTVLVTSTGVKNGNSTKTHDKVTKKHKVFWLTCAPSTQPSTGSTSSQPETPPSTQPATVVPSVSTSSQPAEVQPTAAQVSPSPSTTVLGEKVTRKLPHKPPKAKVKAVKVTQLPFTGVSAALLGVYVPAALGFIFTGLGIIGLTRRTRVRPQV